MLQRMCRVAPFPTGLLHFSAFQLSDHSSIPVHEFKGDGLLATDNSSVILCITLKGGTLHGYPKTDHHFFAFSIAQEG